MCLLCTRARTPLSIVQVHLLCRPSLFQYIPSRPLFRETLSSTVGARVWGYGISFCCRQERSESRYRIAAKPKPGEPAKDGVSAPVEPGHQGRQSSVSLSPSKYCAQCYGPQDLPTRLLGSRVRSFSLHTHPSSPGSHVSPIAFRTLVAEWAEI